MNSGWAGAGLTFIAIAAALGAGAHGVVAFLRAPVEVVRIEGNLTEAEQDQVRSVVMETLQDPMADVNDVVDELSTLGWSRDVRVRRVWPGAIHVRMEHETLSAQWGEGSYLTTSGEVVDLPAPPDEPLPALRGKLSEPVAAMQTFQVLDEDLAAAGLGLRSLAENDLGEWRLELSNGLSVLLGERDLKTRLERFLVVYDKALAGQLDRVELVDARYESGVAVRWRRDGERMVATSNWGGG